MTEETGDLAPWMEIYDRAGPAAASGAVLAWCHKELGEKGFRLLLAELIEPSAEMFEYMRVTKSYWLPERTGPEWFERAAEELALMELPHIADIVVEAASQTRRASAGAAG
jgi:hypothetical protein